MAKPKKTTEGAEGAESAEGKAAAQHAAADAAALAWYRAQVAELLKTAERDERIGPGGSGWTHNESKREEISARVRLLKDLLAETAE